MTAAGESKHSKLPVRFTGDYTCHDTPRSIFGIKFEERWKSKKWLGKGSYGEVWLQQCTTDGAPGRLRAVKRISKVSSSSDFIDHAREIEAIARFSQKKYARYFVRSSGWYEGRFSIFIAMEYMKLGDLQRYLGRALPEVEAQAITFQLLEALQFMHRDGFAHRDLKPANIFVVSPGPSWWVKVGDFGVSKRVDQGLTAFRTVIGTPDFLATEMLKDQRSASIDRMSFSYTTAVDIWSVGVITLYMLTGRLPFAGIPGLLEYTANPDGSPFRALQDHGVTKVGEDFVKRLLCLSPTDRSSAEEALRHSWREVTHASMAVPLSGNSSSAIQESTEPSGRWSALDEWKTRSDTSLTGPSKTRRTAKVRMPSPRNSANVRKSTRDAVDDGNSNTATLDSLPAPIETAPMEPAASQEGVAVEEAPSDISDADSVYLRLRGKRTPAKERERRMSRTSSESREDMRRKKQERGLFTNRWAKAIEEARRQHDENQRRAKPWLRYMSQENDEFPRRAQRGRSKEPSRPAHSHSLTQEWPGDTQSGQTVHRQSSPFLNWF